MTTPDPLVSLRLLISGLISDVDVYNAELPGNVISAPTNTEPPTAIVLQDAGGNSEYSNLSMSYIRVGIRCYAPTNLLTRELYWRVYDILKNMKAQTSGEAKLLSAYKESGPYNTREPDNNAWPVTLSYWVLMFRTTSVVSS